jgi:replicative DNA helicase
MDGYKMTRSSGRTPTVVGTIPDRLQPHNIEAEEAVIGSLLIDPDAILRVSTYLEPDDFFVERNAWIYEAMRNLFQRNEPTDDILTVSDELERHGKLAEIGGSAHLTGLINATPTSVHVDYYASLIIQAADLRRVIAGAGEISRFAFDGATDARDVIDKAEQIIFEIASRHEGQHRSGLRHIRGALDHYHDRLEYLSQHQGQIVGIPTGLIDLDKLIGGLQRSDVIVLAGRPGMGKTSMALAIALNAARKWQKRTAMFSLEMSGEQLIQKLLASETGIDSQRLRQGDLKEGEWGTYYQAEQILSQAPIFIDDSPTLSPYELRSRARRLHAEHGLDLLIIDYLQLMQGDNRSENRQQEITFISRAIKSLARELNIPVLALSQLSRAVENRHDKRPILSDLRESGAIEQDADVVLFLYRDDVYNPDSKFPNIAEIIIAKHRHGPTGVFSAYFKKQICQFIDLEDRTQAFEPIQW